MTIPYIYRGLIPHSLRTRTTEFIPILNTDYYLLTGPCDTNTDQWLTSQLTTDKLGKIEETLRIVVRT
jgi:hypothetical protein